MSSVTDALLTCEEHGVVIFDLSSPNSADTSPTGLVDQIRQRQRELRRKLNARLVGYEELIDVDSFALAFDISVVTFVPEPLELDANIEIASPATLLQRRCYLQYSLSISNSSRVLYGGFTSIRLVMSRIGRSCKSCTHGEVRQMPVCIQRLFLLRASHLFHSHRRG